MLSEVCTVGVIKKLPFRVYKTIVVRSLLFTNTIKKRLHAIRFKSCKQNMRGKVSNERENQTGAQKLKDDVEDHDLTL